MTFTSASLAWFDPFTGHRGNIIPPLYWGNEPTNTAKSDEFLIKPPGTGPFVLETFDVNDQATFIANENYREPNNPEAPG